MESLHQLEDPSLLLPQTADPDQAQPQAVNQPPMDLLTQMQVANSILQKLVTLGAIPPTDPWHGAADRCVEIAQALATALVDEMGAASVQVWSHHPQDGSYEKIAQAGSIEPGGLNRLEPDDTPLGEVVKKGDPILSNNLLAEPWIGPDSQSWIQHEQIQSLATYTIATGSEILGALTFFCRTTLDPEFLEVLKLVSAYTATAWVNARQTAQLFLQAQRDGVIREMSQKLRRSLDPVTMRQILVDCVGSTLQLEGCDLLRLPSQSGSSAQISCNTMSPELWASYRQDLDQQWDPGPDYSAVLKDPVCWQVLRQEQQISTTALEGTAGQRVILIMPLGLQQPLLDTPMLDSEMICLAVYQRRSQPFSQAVVELLRAMAIQAALALDNAHLYEKTRQQRERETLLNSITTAIRSSLDPATLFESITRRIGAAFEADVCTLALWHSGSHYLRPVGIYAPHLTLQELEATLPGLTLLTLPTQTSPSIDWGSQLLHPQPMDSLPPEWIHRLRMGAKLLLEQRTPTVLPADWDPYQDSPEQNSLIQNSLGHPSPDGSSLSPEDICPNLSKLQQNPQWANSPLTDPRGMLLVPLLQGEQLVGGISLKRIGDTAPRWQPEDLELAKAVAEQAAIAIAQARLLTQTQHQAQRESQLRQVAQSFSGAYDPARILEIALRGMAEALDVEECLFVVGPASSDLTSSDLTSSDSDRGGSDRGSLPSHPEPPCDRSEGGDPFESHSLDPDNLILTVQQGYRRDGGLSKWVGKPLPPRLRKLIQQQCYDRNACLHLESGPSGSSNEGQSGATSPPSHPIQSSQTESQIQGILCAPLKSGDRQMMGILCGLELRHRDFTESDEDLLQALVEMTAMALQRAQFYERSRRQEATAAAVRGLTEGREAESRRLAADLHDQTLADLGAMARSLNHLAKDPSLSRDALQTVALMDGQLRDTITELRGIVEDLQPIAMGAFNLGSALRSLMERAAQRSPQPLVTRFEDRSEGRLGPLDPLAQSTLFRIVQEALNNVVKHAHAGRLDVIITTAHQIACRYTSPEDPTWPGEHARRLSSSTPCVVVVRIIDDGVGMPPETARRRGHGLVNMRYRTELVGGSIEWRGRRQGSGTVVELRIPFLPSSGHPTQVCLSDQGRGSGPTGKGQTQEASSKTPEQTGLG